MSSPPQLTDNDWVQACQVRHCEILAESQLLAVHTEEYLQGLRSQLTQVRQRAHTVSCRTVGYCAWWLCGLSTWRAFFMPASC